MNTEQFLALEPSFRAWWHLARACHTMHVAINRMFESHGVTGPQFGVLRCVADAGEVGLQLTELSRLLMVTCGNITGVVDRLVQAGYLRRVRSEADRRVVLAQLTPEGRELYQRVYPAYRTLVTELMGGLTPEQQEILADCSARLYESVDLVRHGAG